jgi:hypothetical protein
MFCFFFHQNDNTIQRNLNHASIYSKYGSQPLPARAVKRSERHSSSKLTALRIGFAKPPVILDEAVIREPPTKSGIDSWVSPPFIIARAVQLPPKRHRRARNNPRALARQARDWQGQSIYPEAKLVPFSARQLYRYPA